jgi:hypothetical protein
VECFKNQLVTAFIPGSKGSTFTKEKEMEIKEGDPQERSLHPARVWRSIHKVVDAAALNAFLQAKPHLNEDGVQRIVANEALIQEAIEKAMLDVLLALGRTDYPILSETSLLKPVATALVPTLATAEELKGFCHSNSLWFLVPDELREFFDASVEQIVVHISSRPYVACALKELDCATEIIKELPEKYLYELTDIIAFVFSQREGESGFLNNDGSENRFLVKAKEGVVFLCSLPAVIWWICRFGGITTVLVQVFC